jgi:hypothetical protein
MLNSVVGDEETVRAVHDNDGRGHDANDCHTYASWASDHATGGMMPIPPWPRD